MIEPDHPIPVLRLVGLAVAGGSTAGLLHGLSDRVITALAGALVTTLFAALLEVLRPALRRHGERLAARVPHPPGPADRSSAPPPQAS